AVIGIVAPGLAGLTERALTPVIGAGSAIVAAAGHVVGLGAALLLPVAADEPAMAASDAPLEVGGWLRATLTSTLAWFGMMAVMAFAPIGLVGCGLGFSTTVGAIAWHVVAMYVPALTFVLVIERWGARATASAGLILLGLAAAVLHVAVSEATIMLALVAAGAGWALPTGPPLISLPRGQPGRTSPASPAPSTPREGTVGARGAR